MELRYENLKNKSKALLAFTGFDVEEFQILLEAFTTAWERCAQQNRLPPEIRQRGYGIRDMPGEVALHLGILQDVPT